MGRGMSWGRDDKIDRGDSGISMGLERPQKRMKISMGAEGRIPAPIFTRAGSSRE